MSGKVFKKLRKEMRRDIKKEFQDFSDYIKKEKFMSRVRIAWRVLWNL
jgi:hypothetical protein